MPRSISFLSLAVVLATLVVGCGSGSTAAPAVTLLPVVATTTQLQDFVREVGGDRISLTGLLGPNVDPHAYEPKPSHVAAIAAARVVVRNGVGLDNWLDPLVAKAGGSASVITAADGVVLLPGDGRLATGDPHIWFDPENALRMVRNIEAALSAADPAGTGTYRANASAYAARIVETDAELKREIASVPHGRRLLVTNHDVFGYFARRYGITIVGAAIPSLSTRAEPSARDLSKLVATMKRLGVRTLFSEESLDPRLQRALASSRDSRARR
ncbi:MAG: zinc ABC transporter substrate-binding protein [Actinobacteria bacterium]|nr:zinc ABC transporter substrate-binding protein [Actinomycetota bacterium]